jgi:hypothetical protein
MNNTSSYQFSVNLVPLIADGQVLPKKRAVLREDTKQIIGVIPDKYRLIPHEEVVDVVRKLVPQDAKESIEVAKNGAYLTILYDIPNQLTEIVKGDEVASRLVIRNIYDGTPKTWFSLGMLRLVCTNGMTAIGKNAQFSIKHFGKLDIDFLKKRLEVLMNSFTDSTELFRTFSRVGYQDVLHEGWEGNDVGINRLFGKKRRELVREHYNVNNDKNLWGLYNACTAVISHEMPNLQEFRRVMYLRSVAKVLEKSLHKDEEI